MHTYIYTHVRMTLINDKTHFAVVTCSCSALILVATNRSLTASIAYSCFARLFIHLHCTYYIKYLKNLLYFISGSQCVIAQQIKIQQKWYWQLKKIDNRRWGSGNTVWIKFSRTHCVGFCRHNLSCILSIEFTLYEICFELSEHILCVYKYVAIAYILLSTIYTNKLFIFLQRELEMDYSQIINKYCTTMWLKRRAFGDRLLL